jgi:hypothetical protein
MFKIELTQKPVRPIIIEGFPGFGFVSTIATEFLIKHLNAKPIGKITSDKLQPIAAIHKNQIVNPLEIFHDKKNNLVIVQAVTPVNGLEWEIVETINELARQLKAKEIIGLEGVNSPVETKDPKVFFFSKEKKDKKSKLKIPPLEEGIIIGVTGALLIKSQWPLSCFFVETHSQLPDNKAAAKLIESLDTYLGLNLNTGPLVDKAKEFEVKIRGLMSKMGDAKEQKAKKDLSYTG